MTECQRFEIIKATLYWNVFHLLILNRIPFFHTNQHMSRHSWSFVQRPGCFSVGVFLLFAPFHPLKLGLHFLALVRKVILYFFSSPLSPAVRVVIEYLWYGQAIMLQQSDSPCPTHSGLMTWSLWPIYFVCNAGKLDSLFPDDSYIDMGEIDVGRKVAQQIPPGIFWRSQVFIDHPMYLKFNVSLSKDALVGIYGRRGLPPSHTQVGNLHLMSSLVCVFCWSVTWWKKLLFFFNM